MLRAFVIMTALSTSALLAQAPRQRQVPPSTTTITGRVVSDTTGDPIARARIALTSPSTGEVRLSDRDGRFTVVVPAVPFTITAGKTSFASREVRISRAQGLVEIRLQRGAVISGRVLDGNGDPLRARVVIERKPASGAAASRVAMADTDDRGAYRIGGVPSGAFVVSATAFDETTQLVVQASYRRLYFPNAASVDEAQEIRGEAGRDYSGIDFIFAVEPLAPPMSIAMRQQMLSSTPLSAAPATATVRGRVVDVDGRPVAHARVALVPPVDLRQWRATMTDDRGGFEFRQVSAGKFRVVAAKDGYEREGAVGGAPGAIARPTPRLTSPMARLMTASSCAWRAWVRSKDVWSTKIASRCRVRRSRRWRSGMRPAGVVSCLLGQRR